ncbi:hypothetical protein SSX86_015180 [Deinandra increscens subsp. villosa]|uniref:DNA-directed RNA polymerase subunit n=1 Tax=Deinandra increscens subsp. villosa TaxID=3103831 RepID=A0AAP0CZL4_9ASTR
MEGLKVSEAELMVYLQPSKSINVSNAIFDELTSMLFKFNETFDGVLLAYSATTNDELAKILPGLHPCFGVRIKAQLLLFHPKPSMILEGKVVKLGPQSIHVVVLGFSSATITEEDMSERFDYKVKHGKELFASKLNKRHKIEVGTVVRFVVNSFDEEILHMSGSLLPAHTGNVNWLDKYANEDLVERFAFSFYFREAKHIICIHPCGVNLYSILLVFSNSKKRSDLQMTDHRELITTYDDDDGIKKSKKHKSRRS